MLLAMSTPITASMLYDLVACPHRVWMDEFGDASDRDEISPFTRLLWERGHAFEKQVIEELHLPFTDLSGFGEDEREQRTLAAMQRGDHLIYSGRIRAGDLLGVPDLLRKDGDLYIAGDIKSGAGEEGASDEDKKPKKHYAVQLALYTDILEQLGLSAGRRGFIWDIHGKEVPYDLAAKPGPKSDPLWDTYTEVLAEARQIIAGTTTTLPALASICKQCHWRTVCYSEIKESNDLTLIPELGRAKRDSFPPNLRTVAALAVADITTLVLPKDKTAIAGMGAKTLQKFQRRAKLLNTPGSAPYLTSAFVAPDAPVEVFFDIEVDPFRDVCYLHGFLERRNRDNSTERFRACFAPTATPEGERQAFDEACEYLRSLPGAAIYYYSPYERTTWRKLQTRFPEVATAEEIEAIFQPPRSVDLYLDVVRPASEWPTNDFSIKTLAKYLEFEWRDTDPSGAASIEWYDQWVRTGDPAVRQRILDYNEDDCRATRVLLDGIRGLPVRP